MLEQSIVCHCCFPSSTLLAQVRFVLRVPKAAGEGLGLDLDPVSGEVETVRPDGLVRRQGARRLERLEAPPSNARTSS